MKNFNAFILFKLLFYIVFKFTIVILLIIYIILHTLVAISIATYWNIFKIWAVFELDASI